MRWPIAASGRVNTVLNNTNAATAGSTFVNGIAISSQGKLQLDTNSVNAADFYVAGLRMKAAGIVRVSVSAPIVRWSGGLPLSASGVLCVGTSAAPSVWVGGIPIASTGRVCVSTVT